MSGPVQQWWQFVVDGEVRRKEIRTDQEHGNSCSCKSFNDFFLPLLPRRNSRIVPKIQSTLPHERTEMDPETFEPCSVRMAITDEDVSINCAHVPLTKTILVRSCLRGPHS